MKKEDKRKLGKIVKKYLPELSDIDDDVAVGEIFMKLYPDMVEEQPTHIENQLKKIRELENPDSSMLGTFANRKNLEGKTKRQEEANKYRDEVANAQVIEDNIRSYPARAERQQEQDKAAHKLFLLRAEQAKTVSREAKKSGLDDATYLALKQTEGENQLSLTQRIGMDKLELDRRWKEIEQDLKAGFIYQQQAYQHLQLLTEYIGGLHEQVLLAGNDRTKALLEEHIAFMETQFRDKQTRLLQSGNGEENYGNTPPDEPSDPR